MNLSSEEDVFIIGSGQVAYTNSVFFDGCRGCSFTDAVDTSGILAAPIRIDANYVDALNLPDFYPRPTSWLIDRGDSTGISRTDLDFFGAPRWYGASPDIGAVEWQGVSSTTFVPNENVSLSVFPNPTQGMLSVTSSNRVTAFTIFDITSRAVLSADNFNASNFTIDLEALRIGTYVLNVMLENGQRTSVKFLRLD